MTEYEQQLAQLAVAHCRRLAHLKNGRSAIYFGSKSGDDSATITQAEAEYQRKKTQLAEEYYYARGNQK